MTGIQSRQMKNGMKKMNRLNSMMVLSVGAAAFGLCDAAAAATVAAASCSYSAVSSAVSAAAPGDTVIVPAGNCTWSSTLSINKGLSLIGAGIGQTVISKSSAEVLISYEPADKSANRLIRISGFTFDMSGGGGAAVSAFSGKTSVPQTKLRIDNNRFQNMALGSTQIQYIRHSGGIYGVVDNNQFGLATYPMRAVLGLEGFGWNNYEGVVFGKADNNLFFEDNVYEGIQEGITDCDNGNRYAYRYNTITLTKPVYPVFDMHGNQGTDGYYACMGGEMYGNKVVGASGGTFLDHRGGRAFAFNNSFVGSMAFQIREEYVDSLAPVSYVGPNGPQYSQKVSGSYYWNNRVGMTGAVSEPFITTDCQACYENGLVAGKDFFANRTTPGITSGPLQNRPASCVPGQGYWATNQSVSDLSGMVGARPATPIAGTLYRCTQSGAWDGGASPLAYPHPLRQVQSAASPPASIAPPTALTVR
jgi:hypothetical protein